MHILSFVISFVYLHPLISIKNKKLPKRYSPKLSPGLDRENVVVEEFGEVLACFIRFMLGFWPMNRLIQSKHIWIRAQCTSNGNRRVQLEIRTRSDTVVTQFVTRKGYTSNENEGKQGQRHKNSQCTRERDERSSP